MSDALFPQERLERRLRRRRALGFAALWFERAWVALWPVLGVCGLFACFALLDLPRRLPPLGQCALLAAFALAVAVLLWRGLAALRVPDAAAVDRRLERDSGLAHRPLATLTDCPVATGDDVGAALWRVHLARSAAQIARLRVSRPRPGLARLDRRALRGGLIVALAASVGIAGGDAPDRLWAAVNPTLPRAPAPPATELQAWITPPPYTGIAPIFLKPGPEDAVPLRVPTGSKLVVSVTGGHGVPSLDLAGGGAAFRALDAGSYQANRMLTASGALVVRRDGNVLARWRIDVIPNLPPKVAWAGQPGPARAQLHTALPWQASDQYGVTSLAAQLRLKDRPTAPAVVVPIPVAGNGKDAHGVAEPDLSANPWAGLSVVARLVAKDATGLEGASGDSAFVLPERHFNNPEARALIAIRKGLSVHPQDRDDALAGLDALLVKPGSIGKDPSAYVNLAGLYYLLEIDRSPAAVTDAQNRLWELALRLEEGAASRTERQLQAALRAARDALTAMRATPDEAHRKDFEAKLRALEKAIHEHMQALAKQFRKDGLPPSAMQPNGRQVTQRDLQRMAEKALDAAKQGNTQSAEQALAQLEQMLDQLRQAHPMTAQDRARQQQQQQGRRQLGVVQDLLTREGGVLDHTQARSQSETRAGQMQQPEPSDQAGGRTRDARVQEALRRALGEVMQQVGDMTGKVPSGLGNADQDMQSAVQALAAGKDGEAQQAELKAVQDLQKGGQQAARQMAQKLGQGQGQQGAQGNQPDSSFLTEGDGNGQEDADFDSGSEGSFGQGDGQQRGRDPLGRRTGPNGNGYDESDDVNVPTTSGPKRTEQIEEELRRRDGERSRPQEERQYIERLLRQF